MYPSWKHRRTKVTPDFHLTYSKNGEIWGRNQNDKNGYFSIFLHKIICCGCVLESPHRGDSNTHKNISFYGELMIVKVKTLVFSENFMSTETFT